MNINFEKIKISNFMSFENATLDFNNNGYTLVSGINNTKDDLAKSNGSGKSSIWESIIWCLTGETIRGTRQVSNRFTNEGALVELYFKIDNNNYKLIRTKDHSKYGTNLKIFVNEEEKSGKGIRDSEKILSDILPDLSSQLVGSVIILGQGLPQRFTNNTPIGRKEVLEKLSKSDFMIEDIKNKLTKRKELLTNKVKDIESNLIEDKSKLSVYQKQLEKLEIEKKDLIYEDFDLQINDLNNTINEYESVLSNLKLKQSEEQSNANINRIKCKNLENELESKKSNLIRKFSEDLQPSFKKEAELKANIRSLDEEIIKLESIKDICPTCGQRLPDVHKVDTTNKRLELQNLQQELNLVLESQTKQKEYNDKEFNFEISNYFTQLEDLDKEYNQIIAIINNISSDISIKIEEIQEYKLNLDKIKLRKENYENKNKTIGKDIEEVNSQINTLQGKILYNISEQDKFQTRLDIVNRMLSIATRDFRGFLLAEVIKFIDTKAKEYSREVFENENIEFKLEGSSIDIYYGGKQYENLSGGEKQKIDLIIQFAIRDMLSQFLNFSSNILVLDEIFDNLDNSGCQKVLDLISNKLNNVENIYIITHHTDIQIPYDKELVIVKENNISYIEN